MKRISACILFLILALSMLGGACAEAADITGAWHSDTMILTLKEGGIYTLEKMDEAMIGTWVLEGDTLYVDKGTLGETTFHYDAAARTLRRNSRLFTRAPIAAEAEDFTGSWTTAFVDAFGEVLPAESAELRMDAVIDGISITLTIASEGETILEGNAVWAEGALKLAIPASGEGGQESIYDISMLETGMIRIRTQLADGTADFYLEKNDPAA